MKNKILTFSPYFEVLNEERSKDSNEEHPANIDSIDLTLEVSNEERSKEFNDEHLKNIESILITFEVSNEDKSKDSNDEHSGYIEYEFVHPLKFLNFIFFIIIISENIYAHESSKSF